MTDEEILNLTDADRWNPEHFDFGQPSPLFIKGRELAVFGQPPFFKEGNQLTIFFDFSEPPDPDDYQTLQAYEDAWKVWKNNN